VQVCEAARIAQERWHGMQMPILASKQQCVSPPDAANLPRVSERLAPHVSSRQAAEDGGVGRAILMPAVLGCHILLVAAAKCSTPLTLLQGIPYRV